jgi:hypothetical protein
LNTEKYYIPFHLLATMPKKSATFDVAPELPTPKRRDSRDLTEYFVDLMAVASTAMLIMVLTNQWIFDIADPAKYQTMLYAAFGLFAVFWFGAIRLDLSAKKNSEKLFETQMKDYEIMRTKWVELASQRLEIEAKKN